MSTNESPSRLLSINRAGASRGRGRVVTACAAALSRSRSRMSRSVLRARSTGKGFTR